MKRTCNVCSTNKDIEDFTITKYKGKIKRRTTCKSCTTDRVKKWTIKNKEKRNKYIENYSEQNKNKINEKSRNYYKANRETIISKNVQYKKNKRKTDDLFRLSENIRKAIAKSFKLSGTKKKSKTAKILGCSFQEFKEHIEKQFESWMNWNNYGKYNGQLNYGWDLDHIIPISSVKTEGDLLKLSHYTNFQPLCSYKNRHIKRDN